MTKRWGGNSTVAVLAVLALAGSAGCPDAPGVTAVEKSGSRAERESVQSREKAGADVVAGWPEGWLVAHHEEWIPVLDELGRRLHAARAAFLDGDRETTATEIRHGLDFLDGQAPGASARDRAAIDSARFTLEGIAARLSRDEDVSLVQLDIAFANASRADLAREGLVVEGESADPYLARPEAHMLRATELFLEGETDEAAREVDRASAYLRLEGNRLEMGARAQLGEAAQDLERLAARLRLKEVRTRGELDAIFQPAVRPWRELARAPARQRSLGLMRSESEAP